MAQQLLRGILQKDMPYPAKEQLINLALKQIGKDRIKLVEFGQITTEYFLSPVNAPLGKLILNRLKEVDAVWFFSFFSDHSYFASLFSKNKDVSFAQRLNACNFVLSGLGTFAGEFCLQIIGLILSASLNEPLNTTDPFYREAVVSLLTNHPGIIFPDNMPLLNSLTKWIAEPLELPPPLKSTVNYVNVFLDMVDRHGMTGRDIATTIIILLAEAPGVSELMSSLLSVKRISLAGINIKDVVKVLAEADKPGSKIPLESILKNLCLMPLNDSSSHFLLYLIEALNLFSYHDVLYNVFKAHIPAIAQQLYIPGCRSAALLVIRRILFSSRGSPEIFLALLNLTNPVLPSLISYFLALDDKRGSSPITNPYETAKNLQLGVPPDPAFETATSAEIQTFIGELCKLCFVGMHLHTGYPEEYIVLNESLEKTEIPRISAEEIEIILKEAKVWRLELTQDNYLETASNAEDQQRSYAIGSTITQPKKGIFNGGNNCYMISFLQALMATDTLTVNLLSRELPILQTPHGISSRMVVKALQSMMGLSLFGVRPLGSPAQLKNALGDIWAGNGQQDTFEFGLALLDHISNVLPQCSQLFEGKLRQSVRCEACGLISTREDTFNSLNLQFPVEKQEEEPLEKPATPPPKKTKNYTLETLLHHSFEPEPMSGDNKIFCTSPTCQNSHQNGLKVVRIASPPDHLIINLASFKYDPKTGNRLKIFDKKVSYLERQKVDIYPDDPATPQSQFYRLTAVVVHSGYTAHSGHYYVYARNSSWAANDDKAPWYKLNDASVGTSNFGAFSKISDSLSSDVPYLLFYVKEGLPVEGLEQPILPDLKNSILQDNQMYRKQLELKKEARKNNKLTLPDYHRRGGPPGGGGHGSGPGTGGFEYGGGGYGFEGTRMIM